MKIQSWVKFNMKKVDINQFKFDYEYSLAKKAFKKDALNKRKGKNVKRTSYTKDNVGED